MTNAQLQPQQQPMAAIMARVSLEKQAKEGYSLPAQIDLGQIIAQKHGVATDERYVLQDAGFSGDDWDRPAINRALTLIRTGKVKVLIFTVSDRFSRDVEGGLRIIREIREAGGRIIFGDLGEYTDDGNFRMMLQIKMAVAEFEKVNIKNRSRSGTLRKVREGHAFGRMRYGFKAVDGDIVRVEAQVAIVRQIFAWADQGWSQRRIIRELVARNVPAPGKTDKKAGNWNCCTVAEILREPFYATGEWYYNKSRGVAPKTIRKPGERHRKTTTMAVRPTQEWVPLGQKVEPVIERAQFERVAASMGRNRNTLAGRPSDRYLLKSLVWCAKPGCGTRCSGHYDKRKVQPTRYVCSNRDRSTGAHLCGAESVLAAALEQTVWNAAMETLGNERTLRAAVAAHMEEQQSATNGDELARLQARIEQLRRTEFKARAEELKANETETARFYREQYNAMMAERRGLEAELVTLVGKGATGKVDVAGIARSIEQARRVDLANAETRGDCQELLAKWIERVDYFDGKAEISLRVPLQAAQNCQPQQPAASSFILLKIERRVA